MATPTTGKGLAPVDALNHLVDIITNYCTSQAFVAGCKLGVFERLAGGALTAEALAERIGIQPVPCRRLLMALEKLGLIMQ